jgi:hypothetical protein
MTKATLFKRLLSTGVNFSTGYDIKKIGEKRYTVLFHVVPLPAEELHIIRITYLNQNVLARFDSVVIPFVLALKLAAAFGVPGGPL